MSGPCKQILFSPRIFDDDEDGHIYAADMVEMLTNLGDKLTKSEARRLVQNADATGDGLIDYTGKILNTCFRL